MTRFLIVLKVLCGRSKVDKEKCEVIITFLDTDKNYEGNSYFKKQSGFDFDYEKGIS